MTVIDVFAWGFATLVVGAFMFALGYSVGARSNRAFHLDQLRQSMEREVDARGQLHRITVALSERKGGIDGGQS